MTKCAAYWRAIEAGKECGAPKDAGTQRRQKQYLEEIVPDLVAMGALENDVFELLPYTVCESRRAHTGHKGIAFSSLQRRSPIRKKMLDFFFENIVSGIKITYPMIIQNGFIRDSWTDDDYKKNYDIKSSGHHLQYDRLHAARLIESRKLKGEITKTINGPIPGSRHRVVSGATTTSPTKNMNNLSMVCTSGQWGILQSITLAGYGDNEYTAFCIALKWAAERLENERKDKETLTHIDNIIPKIPDEDDLSPGAFP